MWAPAIVQTVNTSCQGVTHLKIHFENKPSSFDADMNFPSKHIKSCGKKLKRRKCPNDKSVKYKNIKISFQPAILTPISDYLAD